MVILFVFHCLLHANNYTFCDCKGKISKDFDVLPMVYMYLVHFKVKPYVGKLIYRSK